MLGGLLGRKFSNKCKQSIKCIKTRIVLIRKKKQAMLNFLKKDVADLVAGGHDANALGRMDGLMVEMNNISCYDMIENYCDCILGQLSYLEKQRECPQEKMEAVATLIFAAARFSDLPELGDLRQLFVSRYGCALESSVNTQFVEKIMTKTFSKDKKLKMMQDISHEFSAPWNPELFDRKRIKPSATEVPRKTDLLNSNTKQKNLHAMVNEVKDSGIDVQQERGDTITKQYVSSRGKTESAPKYDVLKEIKQTQVKDMVANPYNDFHADFTNNSRSMFCDEPKNRKPSNTKPGHILNEHNIEQQDVAISSKWRSPRSHEKMDNHVQERQVKELESTYDRINIVTHIKSKGYEKSNTCDFTKSNSCYDKLDSLRGFASSVREVKVAGTVKFHNKNEQSDPTGQSSRELNCDRTQIILPRINGKRLGNHADDRCGREMNMNHGVARNMVSTCMDMKRQYDGDHAVDYLKDSSELGNYGTQEGFFSSVPEKQVAGLDKHVDDRVKNMIPPYVKQTGSMAGVVAKEKERHAAGGGNKLRIQHELEPPSQEQTKFEDVKSACRLPPKVMIPPYVKSDANKKKSYQIEHSNSVISMMRDSDASVSSRSSGNEHNNLTEVDVDRINKPIPRSVRRKHSKLQMVVENNDSIDGTVSMGAVVGSERLMADIIGDEKASDEEETFVDKLLMHYSRKGASRQKSKSRTTRSRTVTADDNVEFSEARKHNADIPQASTFERAFSLPPRQMGVADVGEPVHMSSMEQPDMMTRRGGRVHPRLPDYDDLMVRFNALKRS